MDIPVNFITFSVDMIATLIFISYVEISKWLRSCNDCMLFGIIYEEGKVEYINGVWPNSKHLQLVGSIVYIMHTGNRVHMCKKTAL